jgi:hypothetical protein
MLAHARATFTQRQSPHPSFALANAPAIGYNSPTATYHPLKNLRCSDHHLVAHIKGTNR